jgi:hypothetical protein
MAGVQYFRDTRKINFIPEISARNLKKYCGMSCIRASRESIILEEDFSGSKLVYAPEIR